MASQGTANSRLAQIQMRFQQKQLEEREQRKMEMTGAKMKVPEIIDDEPTTKLNTKSTATKNLSSSFGNGKVRQMFNERRRGAGIDRSNPLKPITSRSSSSSTITSVSSKSLEHNITRRQESTALRPINGQKLGKSTTRKVTPQYINNGNDAVDYSNDENTRTSHKHQIYSVEDDNLDNETFPDQHLEQESYIRGNNISPHDDANNNPKPGCKPKLSAGIKLNPVLTKKSPPLVSENVSGRPERPKLGTAAASQPNSPVNSIQKSNPSKPKIGVKVSKKMARPLSVSNAATKVSPRADSTSQLPGTIPCRICSRFFSEDRVAKHEEVCQKMATKQRKIFDASKHRVKGTEAEKFLKKPPRGPKAVSKTNPANSVATDSSKKSNWRKKHEEFIAAIRAAKEVQAHLAKGGKLSDLPPPPPSENPDYITCPHCSRRFNEAAANRHIPKCANMLHNKPKPTPKRK